MDEREVKQFIITALGLEDMGADDIDTHAPLFGAGLLLDSVDAVELGAALQQRFGLDLWPQLAGAAMPAWTVAKLTRAIAQTAPPHG